MTLYDLFKVAKEVIDAFKDKALHDDKITNKLTQAGGLISLVGIGIELYEKYQDSKKSSEQKAFASLLKFVFQITNNLLTDIMIAS